MWDGRVPVWLSILAREFHRLRSYLGQASSYSSASVPHRHPQQPVSAINNNPGEVPAPAPAPVGLAWEPVGVEISLPAGACLCGNLFRGC